jgi:hypothetical protein
MTAETNRKVPIPGPIQGVGPRRRPRLGRPRLLIVGCGDVGLRIVARTQDRFRIIGAVRSAAAAAAVRAAGATPLAIDLGRRASLARLAGLAQQVLVLAPTGGTGLRDLHAPHLLAALRAPRRGRAAMVYLSTTGVYGDRAGAWVDETSPPRPRSERRLRASAWRARVLRVPGIYAADRLPLERLRAGIPVPLPGEDVVTNHIHAEDLARATLAALFRGRPARVVNATDQTELTLGDYLDRVADHADLPRPPRQPWEALRAAAGPLRMSFLEESRRVRNARLLGELRLRLHYPDVAAGLAAAQASNNPSTDR